MFLSLFTNLSSGLISERAYIRKRFYIPGVIGLCLREIFFRDDYFRNFTVLEFFVVNAIHTSYPL